MSKLIKTGYGQTSCKEKAETMEVRLSVDQWPWKIAIDDAISNSSIQHGFGFKDKSLICCWYMEWITSSMALGWIEFRPLFFCQVALRVLGVQLPFNCHHLHSLPLHWFLANNLHHCFHQCIWTPAFPPAWDPDEEVVSQPQKEPRPNCSSLPRVTHHKKQEAATTELHSQFSFPLLRSIHHPPLPSHLFFSRPKKQPRLSAPLTFTVYCS